MKSIAQRHQEILHDLRGLPDTQQVASYDFVDQAVLLGTFEADHIKAAAAEKQLAQRWPVYFDVWLNSHHEYRHWLDMTTSVFGLQWLCMLAEIIDSPDLESDSPSEDFKNACKSGTKYMASIHLPKYYSTVDNAIGKPWRYTATVGQAFAIDGEFNSGHPLWFVRFASLEDIPIARQPVSVASLLELRAVKAEIETGLGLLSQLPDRDFAAVERTQFTRGMLSRLYEPELTVYSVAAHWFANHRNMPEFIEVSMAASKLAWFCLDAPEVWLKGISASSVFLNLYGPEIAAMMTTSLRRGDRGALYFMLTGDPRIGASTLLADLNRVLKAEWGVSLSALQARAHREKLVLLARLHRSPAIRPLATVWTHNVAQMANGAELSAAGKKTKLPAVLLADDTPLNVRKMKMGRDAFDKQIFDPRPFFDPFMNAGFALSRHGTYSDRGLHCFSDR